jgi:hypothetical protein
VDAVGVVDKPELTQVVGDHHGRYVPVATQIREQSDDLSAAVLIESRGRFVDK